ncbi:MAG: hypothetical protein FWF17_11175 [Betaproteobacteria bacterium]|nr:hypothetical protein [Betaproteobacteria bacterium]
MRAVRVSTRGFDEYFVLHEAFSGQTLYTFSDNSMRSGNGNGNVSLAPPWVERKSAC